MSRAVPAISVVMPIYNAERYVAQAIESILSQTFRDFEFIIVDDGSGDASLEIARHYADHDDRIQIVSRSNTGILGALQDGVELSKGKFIARMDADDVSRAVRFQKQLDFLKTNPECVVVGSNVLMIDPEGSPICIDSVPGQHNEIITLMMKGKVVIKHPTAMIRGEDLRAVGGYHEYPAEDYDLWWRLSQRGKLAILSDVLLEKREHFGSFTLRNRRSQIEKVSEILSRYVSGPKRDAANVAPSLTWEYSEESVRSAWVRQALNAGYFQTARRHAVLILRRDFKNASAWRWLILATIRCRGTGIRSRVIEPIHEFCSSALRPQGRP